jgi:hypothetical protein
MRDPLPTVPNTWQRVLAGAARHTRSRAWRGVHGRREHRLAVIGVRSAEPRSGRVGVLLALETVGRYAAVPRSALCRQQQETHSAREEGVQQLARRGRSRVAGRGAAAADAVSAPMRPAPTARDAVRVLNGKVGAGGAAAQRRSRGGRALPLEAGHPSRSLTPPRADPLRPAGLSGTLSTAWTSVWARARTGWCGARWSWPAAPQWLSRCRPPRRTPPYRAARAAPGSTAHSTAKPAPSFVWRKWGV